MIGLKFRRTNRFIKDETWLEFADSSLIRYSSCLLLTATIRIIEEHGFRLKMHKPMFYPGLSLVRMVQVPRQRNGRIFCLCCNIASGITFRILHDPDFTE